MRVSWTACTLALAACGRVAFEPVGVGGVDGAPRKPITIAGAGEALIDFPVSIIIEDDADLAGLIAPDGANVAFVARDGTVLPCELVTVDATGGGLEAWVSVPTLPPTGVTIYLEVGAAAQTRTSPWDARFAAVWHMALDGLAVRDSTDAHTVVAASSERKPAPAQGIAGAAVAFDGIDDSMSAGDPGDGSLDFGLAPFSYGMWVHVTTSAGLYDAALHKGGSSEDVPGYDVELGTGEWGVLISDGLVDTAARVGDESEFLGRWVHIAGVVDRESATLSGFADGGLRDTASLTTLGPVDTAEPLQLSRTMDLFAGRLDEVRVYRTALTAAWIAAEHANLAERDRFVVVGPLE